MDIVGADVDGDVAGGRSTARVGPESGGAGEEADAAWGVRVVGAGGADRAGSEGGKMVDGEGDELGGRAVALLAAGGV